MKRGTIHVYMSGGDDTTCGRCQRLDFDGDSAMRAVERGLQPGRPLGLGSFHYTPTYSLPSDDSELWRERVQRLGYGDILAGLEASAISSLLMTKFSKAGKIGLSDLGNWSIRFWQFQNRIKE
jgi:hypothetical protein